MFAPGCFDCHLTHCGIEAQAGLADPLVMAEPRAHAKGHQTASGSTAGTVRLESQGQEPLCWFS